MTIDYTAGGGPLGDVTVVYQPADSSHTTILQLNAPSSTTESGSGGVPLSSLTLVGGDYEIGLVVNQDNSTGNPILLTSLTFTVGATVYTVPVGDGVFLSDNPNGAGTADYGLLIPADLFPGASGSSTFTITATIQDAVGGPERFVTLTPTFVAAPEISVTKDVFESGHNVDGGNVLAGQAIEWDYTVTNTGNVALDGATLVLTDNDGTGGAGQTGDDFNPVAVLGGVAGTTANASHNYGDLNNNGMLDVGETWLFTAAGTAVTGPYTNTVTVTDGAAPQAQAQSSYTGVDPSVSIVKHTLELHNGVYVNVDGGQVLDGATLEWTYDVTSNVAIPAAAIAVTDDNGGVGSPSTATYVSGDADNDGKLDNGETWHYVLTGGAAGPGPYTNTGTVNATYTDAGGNTDPVSDTDTSSYTGVDPSITVEKHTLEWDTNAAIPHWVNVDAGNVIAGKSIEWTYAVTSNVTIDGSTISVTDTPAGAAAAVLVDGVIDPTLKFNFGDTNQDGLLESNETWRYVITSTAGAVPYSNTGEVDATYTDAAGNTDPISDTDTSSYTGVTPSISVEKHTFEYNTTTHLWAPVDGGKVIAGKDLEWTYAVTTSGPAIAGSTIVVTDDNGTAGNLLDDKTAMGVLVNGIISPVLKFNIGDTNQDGLLENTETWRYVLTGTAGDGAYTNTGAVSAVYTDAGGNQAALGDTDTSSYTGVAPSISINKVTTGDGHTGDGIVIKEGDAVTWTYTVSNLTGDVGILGSTITVTDNVAGVNPAMVKGNGATTANSSHDIGDLNNNGVLDVGETWTYSASGIAVLGGYSNTGTANASYTDAGGNTKTLSVSDGSGYTGSFVEGVAGLSQGYWYNHTTQTKQDPNHHWASEVNVNGVWGVLLGDSTGALAGHTLTSGQISALFANGELFIPDTAAIQLINASQSATDTRQTLMSQAIAAQLNINNHDVDPGAGTSGDLIKYAVAWLEGAAPFSGFADHSSGNVDKLHDGILGSDDYNSTKAAFTFEGGDTTAFQTANKVLTSNLLAWQFQETFLTPGTFISPSGAPAGGSDGLVKADGEGLKNALMAFNQNQLVTDNFGHVAWNNSGSFTYEINNDANEFWAVLAAASGLHGIV